jgi:hypothetical protein
MPRNTLMGNDRLVSKAALLLALAVDSGLNHLGLFGDVA